MKGETKPVDDPRAYREMTNAEFLTVRIEDLKAGAISENELVERFTAYVHRHDVPREVPGTTEYTKPDRLFAVDVFISVRVVGEPLLSPASAEGAVAIATLGMKGPGAAEDLAITIRRGVEAWAKQFEPLP